MCSTRSPGPSSTCSTCYPERGLRGRPGEIIATRNGAICRATVDGAVWITHLKAEATVPRRFKLPATRALELAGHVPDAPEIPVALHAPIPPGHTYREISYEEKAGVGYLNFDFYNGAMSTEQCRRLREAYRYARSRRQTKVIVLAGGIDFFSNGIHLNVIEAAADQGEESWYNLHAIDDIVREIVETDSHVDDLGAVGRRRRRRGAVRGRRRPRRRPRGRRAQPVLPAHGRAVRLRVLDLPAAAPSRPRGRRRAHERAVHADRHAARGRASGWSTRPSATPSRASVRRCRAWPSAWHVIPTLATGSRTSVATGLATSRSSRSAAYRTEEMARSHECFFGEDRSYHVARSLFVYKTGAPCKVALPAAPEIPPRRRRSPRRSAR